MVLLTEPSDHRLPRDTSVSPTPISRLYGLSAIEFKFIQSRQFWYRSTQLDELFRMSYHLYFRFFYPKIELGPPFGFSIFRELYLCPKTFANIKSGTIRLSSSRWIEWCVFRVNFFPPVYYSISFFGDTIGLKLKFQYFGHLSLGFTKNYFLRFNKPFN